jgi:protein-S-isoprenylcysteine O-methyltransferase Ste14
MESTLPGSVCQASKPCSSLTAPEDDDSDGKGVSLDRGRRSIEFILRRSASGLAALASLSLLLFTLAGRIDIPGFWIHLVTASLYQVVSLLIIVPRYPTYMVLDDARRARHAATREWDRVILWALAGATFLMYGLAALDLGRLHLGRLSPWLALPGVMAYVAGSMLNQWAMVHNLHFERTVRIQHERGHSVARTGPCRHVRHPGYLGSILFYVAFPLISGSTLAFLGGPLGIVGTCVRTGLEDGTLRQELTGYSRYAQAVRYRLIPRVW